MRSISLTFRSTKQCNNGGEPTARMAASTVSQPEYSAFSCMRLHNSRNDEMFCAAYMSTPCHVELVLSEREAPIKSEVGSNILPLFWR